MLDVEEPSPHSLIVHTLELESIIVFTVMTRVLGV